MRARLRAAALALILGMLAATLPGRAAPRGPRDLVVAYMNALQHRDLTAAMAMIGVRLPPPVAALLTPTLEGQTYFQWAVKQYSITNVRIDGGLAVVSVSELRFLDLAAQLRARFAPLTPFAQTVRWGDHRVNERFILIRPDREWLFDSCHSGISLANFPVQALMEAASKNEMPSPALQKQLADFVNHVGIGQLMQSMSSSAPVLGLVAAIAIPNFEHARNLGQLTACESNLKNIGVALEMYATDNNGVYPKSLDKLTPNYLRYIPTCPSAGSDTYTPGYSVSGTNYTVICSGDNHHAVGLPPDYPRYTSTQGLIVPEH